MGKKRRRKNNIGNVAKVQHFLESAYALDTKIINFYHMRIFVEEFEGWFDWFHTTGTTRITSRGIDGGYSRSFGCFVDEEDLAIAITKSDI